MPRKQVQLTEIVDMNSGAVVSATKRYISKYSERFIMLRTTVGFDWILSLSKRAVYLALYCLDKTNADMVFSLPTDRRIEIVEKFSLVNDRMLTAYIRELLDNGIIKHVVYCDKRGVSHKSKNSYYFTPAIGCKRDTKEWIELIKKYDSL